MNSSIRLSENNLKTRPYKSYFILSVVYFLSYGLMLFDVNGLYGDADWRLFHMDPSFTLSFWKEHGSPFVAYKYNALKFIFGMNHVVHAIHVMVFFCYFTSMVIFYHILSTIKSIGKSDAFFITLLAMTFSSNEARNVAFFSFYAFDIATFMIGFFLITSENYLLRLLSLTAFFVSFFTQSLLVFYIIPFSYLIYCKGYLHPLPSNKRDIFNALKFIFTKIDFLLLPIVFYTLKKIIWSPYGIHDGYNSYNLSDLLIAFPKTIYAFHSGFFNIIDIALSNFSIYAVVYAIAIYIILPFHILEKRNFKFILTMLFVGAAVFYIGAYPYFVAHKLLEINDNFDSRDQLLVGFGAGMMLYYGVRLCLISCASKICIAVFCLFASIFINYNISHIMEYRIDAIKTNMIVKKLIKIDEIKAEKGSAVVFIDNSKEFNVFNRSRGFTELSGMLRSAYGGEYWLGYVKDVHPDAGNSYYDFYITNHNNISGYLGKKASVEIVIDTKVRNLTLLNKVMMILYGVFIPQRLEVFLNDIQFVSLKYKKLK